MGGGLLQLVAKGAQDFKLTGNPQISFFKIVYRRYTNFSMESIKLNLSGNPGLGESETTEYKCKIDRDADLVSDIYFCFELPDIYSGKHSRSGSEPFYNYEFKWIKNIGINIFDYMQIKIGGVEIDKQYSEWLYIWSQLNLSNSEKEIFDEMIGNVPELYEPENGLGQNGSYPHISTASNTDNSVQADRWDDFLNKIITIEEAQNASLSVLPSIRKRKIKVPLNFWFNKNIGLALPLVALQYHEVELVFRLRPIYDLYTIIETDSTKTLNHRRRIKPLSTNTNHLIQNFLLDTNMVSFSGSSRTLIRFDIKPYLEANYIYLENEERLRFASYEHEYLIEQVSRVSGGDFTGVTSTVKDAIKFNHPVKYISWVGTRSDASDRNDWNNYTNWLHTDIPPYSKEYNSMTTWGTNLSTTALPYYNLEVAEHKTNFKSEYFNKNILNTAEISFNGMTRLNEKDSDYFNKVQIYKYFKGKPNDNGIYVYSFSLNPGEHQPSGTCNFSNLDRVELFLNVYEPPKNGTTNYYDYNFNIYAVNYNVLKIMSGLGSVEFA